MSDDATKGYSDAPEDLIALYALDALDADDRARVESYLASDARARASLDDMLETVGVLHTRISSVPPSARVKERLLARVDADLTTHNLQHLQRQHQGAWARLKRLLLMVSPVLAAAAVVLAIGLGAWAISLNQQLTQARQELVLLQAPGLRMVLLPKADKAPEGTQANLIMSPQGSTGLLTVSGLNSLPASQTYQFWLLRGGQPIPAGTFDVDASGAGKLIVHSTEPLNTYDQAGITVEPAGGSATPTLSALVSIGSIQ